MLSLIQRVWQTLFQAKEKKKKLTQAQFVDMTGIHRAMLSRLEGQDIFLLSSKLQSLAEVLDFEVTDLFEEEKEKKLVNL